MKTLFVLLDKEIRQFFRNAFLPKLVIVFPVMVILIIPWVTTMDVRHIGVSVVDNDHSETSRRIIQKIEASDYFNLRGVTESYDDSFALLEGGEADVILTIPNDFELSLIGDSPKRIGIDVNGINAMKGGLGSQYMVQLVMQTFGELQQEKSVVVSPDLFTALNLVSEKEIGTIEQINVTPVSRLSFTLAKLIPYWIIGFLVLTVAMVLAWLVYGLSPEGSPGSIYLAALLIVFTMSGMGVTIANNSSTMQQTMFVMFFFVMIFILMSGLFTPIESMPTWAQWITYILPPRYFVEVMRSVYLKGTMFIELWPNYVALAVFAVLFNSMAALTYKKQA